MNIQGIGMVFARGLGIDSFEQALQDGWTAPAPVEARWAPGGKTTAYLVDLDAVPDKTLLKKIRRADKLSKMAVLAAADAVRDSGLADLARKGIGVILATGFGAHATTFAFLDDILTYGDAAVSPTAFSNSVHNAAASYVSSSLGIQGPTLTVTQFRFSFQTALQLARTWIDQKRCGHVLVGAVDQYGDVLGYVSSRKLTHAEDGKIRPFRLNPTAHVPGEGAAFFLVGRERTEQTYCAVQNVATNLLPDEIGPADLVVLDADGMLPDESAYRSCCPAAIPAAAYAPLFGSMMSGSAFNAAAGALMLKRRMRYASPILDNPHGLNVLATSGQASLQTISCVGCSCSGERAIVSLSRS